jgi:DNA topoisomerase-1
MLSTAERAISAGLVYADPEKLPLRRRKRGAGFSYVDQHSHPVSDAKLRSRLDRLAVPPAWDDVRLARNPASHIQAVGRDAAGRLQYRYHEKWTETGDAVKQERLANLGAKLGDVRSHIEAQLRRQTIDQDFAAATAIALLDRVGLRVGYPEYSREDGGRGATTLTRKDVAVKDGVIRLRFFGKGGKRIQRILDDAALARALAALKAQPGEMLFRWKDKAGEDQCLTAEDVNMALRERFGEGTSARDFRTFRASAIVAGALQGLGPEARERDAALRQAIRDSSQFLANTPAVARSSYVHPLVQEAFADKDFDSTSLFTGSVRIGLARDETALLRLLSKEA